MHAVLLVMVAWLYFRGTVSDHDADGSDDGGDVDGGGHGDDDDGGGDDDDDGYYDDYDCFPCVVQTELRRRLHWNGGSRPLGCKIPGLSSFQYSKP